MAVRNVSIAMGRGRCDARRAKGQRNAILVGAMEKINVMCAVGVVMCGVVFVMGEGRSKSRGCKIVASAMDRDSVGTLEEDHLIDALIVSELGRRRSMSL